MGFPVSSAARDADRLEPLRHLVTEILLKEALLLDAIRVPVERLRSINEVRQHHRGDGPVVVDEVAFGVTLPGKVDAVEVGELGNRYGRLSVSVRVLARGCGSRN